MSQIILGVGGGIAAYKACELIRRFKKIGEEVRVIPTSAALNFVGANTFAALSGNKVHTEVVSVAENVNHVSIAKQAKVILIAPATADLIARLAAGFADDLLTATVLSATCLIILAPAMHSEMWFNPVTQTNVAKLKAVGMIILAPTVGELTSGDVGAGRMLRVEEIFQLTNFYLSHSHADNLDLKGLRILITAGASREALDPVRFLSNNSSGKQGYALAQLATQLGAEVTFIISRSVTVSPPERVRYIYYDSAKELNEIVRKEAKQQDIIIMAAAVSDYQAANYCKIKIKKKTNSSTKLELISTPDVLSNLIKWRINKQISPATTIMGFAAETGDHNINVLEMGKQKIAAKKCDLLMVNDVSDGKGFGKEENSGWLLSNEGKILELEVNSKITIAYFILMEIIKYRTKV